MKAVVFHGIGDIRLDNVREPKIQNRTDAIVRLTASAICGTDLHMIRGTMPGMRPGTILGHEGVAIVEEIGLRNLNIGDRIVIPSTIACGSQTEPLTSAIEAYKAFDQRQPGGLKAELEPAMAHLA